MADFDDAEPGSISRNKRADKCSQDRQLSADDPGLSKREKKEENFLMG